MKNVTYLAMVAVLVVLVGFVQKSKSVQLSSGLLARELMARNVVANTRTQPGNSQLNLATELVATRQPKGRQQAAPKPKASAHAKSSANRQNASSKVAAVRKLNQSG